jgi:FkbM family methyltransferase
MSGTATLHHHLHTVVFGGDRLDPTYLRPWVSRYRLDQIRLVNMYGITETTVHVTHHTLTERDVWGDSGRSVIGVPIPETQVYILNEAMQEQPVGVPGEIYVGGSGVSAGYWGQPELTAERFVEPVTGMRIYKSGDLGRWLPDGSLEHLGRNDFQVQLRGFRVELGEIEQVILANPLVSKVTVIAQGDGADGRIVAYVIPDENVAPAVNAFATLQQTGELDGRTLTQLPNQQMIAHLNQNETDFVYNEIFVDHCYLQHGIVIKAGDTVVDVGANIGMFSLFAAQQAADVTIHAFEPLPTAFACLQLNGRLHNLNLKAHQMGISDQMGKTSFDFYPHVSILSGQFTGADDEREIVRETVRQFLNQQGESEFIEELLDQRLQYETITAELTTLSHMIEQEKIEQIDLLKVDVEKGERAVLNSIDGADWLKIKQVVMELHDVDGTLAWVIDFLEEKGFSVATAQDETLTTTHLYNLYATRAAGIDLPVQSNVVHENLNPNLFIEQLRAGIGLALPDYMVPANFVLLGHFPLTRNGKIDRKALPLPEQAHLQVEVILPRTTVESEMVAIWQEVLGVDMIGITDNFFTLGGHSLLATQLMVRIPAVFGVELPLSAIFESPTVAELAERVETLRWAAGLTEKDKEGGVTESVREEGRL